MLFCPYCATLLTLSDWSEGAGAAKWACSTCTYTHAIDRKMIKKISMNQKKIDAVEMERNNMTFDSRTTCPKCNIEGVFFVERQTRSADEPATIFYYCPNNKCKHTWSDR